MADGGLTTPRSRLNRLAVRVRTALGGAPRFTTSSDYWENRYRKGGNSGAGSYNRLADFKAEVVNEFVAGHGVGSVIEFGVGDGAQLQLAKYPSYIGFDVSETVVALTGAKFADDPSVQIRHTSDLTDETKADLTLSLDVIYHLVEDETFDGYMRQLFDASTAHVIVYASNTDSAWPNPHVRHREFTRWVSANRPDFALTKVIDNRYPYSDKDPENTSFANFYFFTKSPS